MPKVILKSIKDFIKGITVNNGIKIFLIIDLNKILLMKFSKNILELEDKRFFDGL